ncbi:MULTISPECIES: hypothetical protein [unclassified Streptomyces]|uniref:hypothetical protein n=1 Tax=unclassified Streptomyces TaxID=2593676 RepID=UPI0033CCBA0B
MRRALIPAAALVLSTTLTATASAEPADDAPEEVSSEVKVEKAGKISVEVSGSIEASANAIVAKSKATYGIKVVGEVGITVGHEYSHDIPSRKYGHLQYGSWGYKTKWTKYETSADRCGKVKLGSGSAKLPTKSTGWRFWTTGS